MKFSIVIPSKNDPQNVNLEACLMAMKNLSVEIIVVDWGSEVPIRVPDGIKVFRVPPEVARVRDKDSYFAFVIAANAGIRRASGEYVFYFGNDTFCDSDCLNWLEENIRDRVFYLISRKHVDSPETKNQFMRSKFSTNYGASGAFLANKNVWRALRGFDEKYIYYGWTDRETVERAKLLGFRVRLIYEASVYHIRHTKSLMRRSGRINEKVFPKDTLIPTHYQVNDENWGLGDIDLEYR